MEALRNEQIMPYLTKLHPSSITEMLTVDYVMYRIECIGYGDLKLFPDQVNQTRTHPDLEKTLHLLIDKGAEFEKQFKARFINRKALISRVPQTTLMEFIKTAHCIFQDNISWGKIVGYFAFCGSYCVECVDQGLVRVVRDVVEYAVKYLNANINPWVKMHGGWELFHEMMRREQFNQMLKL